MSELKKVATRAGFGEEILKLGKENPDILVIDADIGKSCKTGDFRKELSSEYHDDKNQYVNVGIAEQNAAGVAAGLATCGKGPFVVTYAVFGSLRMCEMIRQEICYPNLNVKIACSHGGLTPANDGASHQAIEDMGVLRTLPNMTVIMPADYVAAKKLTRQAAETYGPMYLRFTRDAIPQIYDEDAEFVIGKANQLKEGLQLSQMVIPYVWHWMQQKSWRQKESQQECWICTPSNLWIQKQLQLVSMRSARLSQLKIIIS